MKNVQDIYPVSPMQELMLLHALAQKDADALFNQFCFQIDADLDVTAFKHAWCKIIDRHDALRTAFIWEGIKQPQQVVRETVKPTFTEYDWRALKSAEQEEQIAKHLAQDRRKGFDPRRAPLTRFSIIQIGEHSWRFIWSSHHLIIDRWCLGQLFAEFNHYYFNLGQDDRAPVVSAASSFREYITWIQRQDRESAFRYWKTALQGFNRPLKITAGDADTRTGKVSSISIETLHIPSRMFDEIAGFVKKRGLTLSTVLQGAWALTLNRIARTQDAVFGATVSGRPPEIPNVESIVGSFINNVPVRVQMPPDIGMLNWLTGIQAAQYRRTAFDYLAPGDIQSCCEVADSEQLFDTLLVWLSGDDWPTGLPMRALSSQYATALPLTLSIAENKDGLMLRADSRSDCVLPLHELLHEFLSSLHAMLKTNDRMLLGDLPEFHQDAAFTGSLHSGSSEIEMDTLDATSIDGVTSGRERLGTGVLQELLRGEWTLVLGIRDLQPDLDFFELGGSSLQAARLHARIEKSTRQSLPLLTLFHKPTISGMAKTLFDEDWPLLISSSIGLRTTGQSNPLFCIASPEVNTVGYSLLTRHLPEWQDVYVVQEPPDSGRLCQVNPSALPAFAGRYVESIRKIQPEGPYRLLGMCAGSHIALEIARRFEADNETIELLGVINTWGLYTISRLYYLNRLINILKYYAGRIRELVPLSGVTRTTVSEGATLQQALIQQSLVLPTESAVGADNPWIRDVGFEHCDPRKPKIASEITVFRIKPQVFWRIRDEGLGWSKQASSVSVVHLSCDDHDEIMREQHIRHLAESIQARLGNCNNNSTPMHPG